MTPPPPETSDERRLLFLADLLETRWVTQRASDDSARPNLIVEIPARELDATIRALREAEAHAQQMRESPHDAGCHPSEGRHTERCQRVKAKLAAPSAGEGHGSKITRP